MFKTSSNTGYFLGLDIGGTKCAVSLAFMERNGIPRIAAKEIVNTDSSESPENFLRMLVAIGKRLAVGLDIPQSDISAIGVTCGGYVDSQNGVVVTTPVISSWRNVQVVKVVGDESGLPVFLQNDANACALAEWMFGAGRGTRNMVFLTCGTGIGAGLIVNGQLAEGANGNAGEVGHIRLENWGPVACGKSGSLESFASGYGIAQLGKIKAAEILQSGGECSFCRDTSKLESVTAKSLAEAAQNGDLSASQIFATAGEFLGRGIAVICDILNPELVVVGSVFARSENLLRMSMEKAFLREAQTFTRQCCKVVVAQLGDNVGDYAALTVAINGLDKKTTKG